MTKHTGTIRGGEVSCSCGWESGVYVNQVDAYMAFKNHLSSMAVIDDAD